MILKIKKLLDDAIVPKYETDGAVAFDLCSIEDRTIYFNQMKMVHTGLAVQIPEGYEMTVRQRSGMSLKYHNYIVISIGTIDQDYRGEIMVPIINRMSKEVMRIKKGDRIAQAVISPIIRCEIKLVDELDSTDRGSGGFGSTGGN
jgi:dUTP pyrophosphatase